MYIGCNFFLLFSEQDYYFLHFAKNYSLKMSSHKYFFACTCPVIFFSLHNLESEIFNQKKRRKKTHTQYIYYLTSSEWSEKISSSDSGI